MVTDRGGGGGMDVPISRSNGPPGLSTRGKPFRSRGHQGALTRGHQISRPPDLDPAGAPTRGKPFRSRGHRPPP
eukprot:9485013-Pyramimonas_sp.AAC.1